MTGLTIHQLLPTLSPRDAVGNSTLELHDLLTGAGYKSNIYSTHVHHELADVALPLDRLPDDESWVIYHHSIGGAVGNTYEMRTGRRILVYHNITPLEMIERWAPEVGAEIMLGYEQTARYADVTDIGVADSDFSRLELDDLGYQRTITIPVMFEPDRLSLPPKAATRPRGARLLFVGRLAPNKAQHELVTILAVMRATTDPHATLTLVGSRSFATYADALMSYVEELGLGDAVAVHETSDDADLATHYAEADVFCCVSDHEGFCVPVVEAMSHGVPVVAYGSSAVRGTVDDGGLVLDFKSPDLMAAAVQRITDDDVLRDRLIDAGRRRAASFALERSRRAWSDLVDSLDESK